jgi:hypothetical protein
MKHTLLSLLLFVSICTFAQDKKKIKGNREVIKDYKVIEAFSSLILNDDLEVRLLRSDEPAIEITADYNLIDVIDVSHSNGELSLKTNQRISSYKKLEITIFYVDSLKRIAVNDKAELHSDVTLKFNELSIINSDHAKTFLTVKANKFVFTNNHDSEAKLNITSDDVNLKLNDNSSVEALLNGNQIAIDMVQRAEAKIEGDANTLDLNIDNSCEFDGLKLTAVKAKLFTGNRCEVKIDIKETLELSATGTSKVSIYGTPKINLIKFEDEAILYKVKNTDGTNETSVSNEKK